MLHNIVLYQLYNLPLYLFDYVQKLIIYEFGKAFDFSGRPSYCKKLCQEDIG